MEGIILAFEVLAYATLVVFSGTLNSKYYERKKITYVNNVVGVVALVAFLTVSVSWTLGPLWKMLLYIVWHLLIISGIIVGVYELPALRLKYAKQRKIAWMMILLSAGFEALALFMHIIQIR